MPWRNYQRPQFFRNRGNQFEEVRADEIGPWFAGEYLCRGLARLDWNLDGRMDFVASRIHAPASVLINESAAGNYLSVIVKGTTLDRDSFGAKVTVTVGNRMTTKQVTAGDGYMASNQRVLQFGIGQAAKIDSLRVSWPNGSTLLVSQPPINELLILTEGVSTGTAVANSRLRSIAAVPGTQ